MNGYALLDEEGGWLVNTIVWNGNLEDWQPPAGTIAKRIEEIDISQLPERPENAI
jgi:hypothetical protein